MRQLMPACAEDLPLLALNGCVAIHGGKDTQVFDGFVSHLQVHMELYRYSNDELKVIISTLKWDMLRITLRAILR